MAGPTVEVNPSPDCIFGSESPLQSCKSSSLCTHCGGNKLWRDGHKLSIFGDNIQRWLCRDCGLRFSDLNDIQKSWSRAEKITKIHEQPLKSAC